MLAENEERLRASTFELVLAQLPLLPQKFIFADQDTPETRRKFDLDWQ